MVNICPGVMFLPVFHKDQSMIYLMVFSVAQNCLQMKPRYLQQYIILTMQRMIWIITWPKSRNGLSNPDISKHADEVIFSRKRSIASHLPLTFNNTPVAQRSSQKHLRMHFDKKLSFEDHLNKVESKVNKTIRIIRKF